MCVFNKYSINLVNTIKQIIMVFQLIMHDSPGRLHTPGVLSFKHYYVGKAINCSMQRSHQHCACFAEFVLKRFISKVKETNIYFDGSGKKFSLRWVKQPIYQGD